MPHPFDRYRERLVMETETHWPADCPVEDASHRSRLALLLHASAEEAVRLEYVRTHTGFCRRIVVTPADLERLANCQD